jgi:hypothetical protein
MTMNVRRLTSLLALLFELSCGRSPVSPSPTTSTPAPAPARSVTGSWTGTYLPVCPTSPNCASVSAGPNGPQPFALTLRQEGETLTGQINLSGWLPRVADVTGTIASNGAMTLSGGDSWPAGEFCFPAGGWNITGWNGRFDAPSNTISGDFGFVTQKHLSSCYYLQDLQVNATTMALRPGAPPDATLAGHWQGSYAIRKCTPVGWNTCIPTPSASDFAVNLQLTQNGTAVSGSIVGITFANSTPLPVTGSMSGPAALTLDGSRTEDVSSAIHIIRLTAWSVTIDAVGRMQGPFSYIDEVRWTSGANAGTTWSTSYDAELRHVVRVPW